MKILICKDKKTEYEARMPSAGKSNADVRRGKKVTRMPSARKGDANTKRGKEWCGRQAVKKWHRCPEREKVTRVSSAGKDDADTKRA